jgi:hypothetical protein
VAATAEGLTSTSVVRRWARRWLSEVMPVDQPATAFSPAGSAAMLDAPVGAPGPEPTQREQWERSPPAQP